VDPLTHGVASFALQRAFFPKAKSLTVAAMLVAGLFADLDSLAALSGPAAYITWHRGAVHSLLAALFLSPLAVILTFAALLAFGIARWDGIVIPLSKAIPSAEAHDPRTAALENVRSLLFKTSLACLASALLHLVLDVCQSDGVGLFWPFSSQRLSLDVLPKIDPWLLTILIGAIVVPELFRLVSDEIGARNKRPHGRNGALVGLLFALVYLGLRSLLHANTVASLEAHTIAGETPHRVGAFPDSTSPFLWHSVVETQSALNLVAMRSMGGEVSYASGVTALHKPDPSPILAAAQNSGSAVTFLRFARFPKATVETELEGYSVEIMDLKDQAADEKSRVIFADIHLDKNARVVGSALQWQKDRASSR
jgi:membrane-bound metal-dependent hydrolase YbcI (DUF457 family)